MSGDDEDIANGIHAQQILDDPMVIGAFAAMEANYIRQWRGDKTPEGDLSTLAHREGMWLLLQNLDNFRAAFETYIRRGKVVVARNEQREKAKNQDG